MISDGSLEFTQYSFIIGKKLEEIGVGHFRNIYPFYTSTKEIHVDIM